MGNVIKVRRSIAEMLPGWMASTGVSYADPPKGMGETLRDIMRAERFEARGYAIEVDTTGWRATSPSGAVTEGRLHEGSANRRRMLHEALGAAERMEWADTHAMSAPSHDVATEQWVVDLATGLTGTIQQISGPYATLEVTLDETVPADAWVMLPHAGHGDVFRLGVTRRSCAMIPDTDGGPDGFPGVTWGAAMAALKSRGTMVETPSEACWEPRGP